MDVEGFLCFQLNQCLILDLEPIECVTLALVRSRDRVSGGARPAGLGFYPIHLFLESKLVELVRNK